MGGLGNTFALKDSDVDLCITNTQELDHWKLHQLKREFEKSGIYFATLRITDAALVGHQTELLLHTYIPLFRLSVTRARWPKQVQVEISWKNDVGIYKTELLAAYSRVDSRVKSLVVFIKYWSKRRGLTNTTPGQGGMGSFAWSLLCIYFLMKATTPQVVPNLQAMATTRRSFQEYDISFEQDPARLWTSSNVKVPALVLQASLLNEQTVGTLVKEFFEFANSFDFDRRVVSIRKPEHGLTKSDKGWTSGLVLLLSFAG
jgi:DNA polymerase sigma